MSGHPKNAERGLWPPRRRVLAAVAAALLVAGYSAWRVERHVGQARLEFRLAEAATAAEEFASVAEQAPELLGLAARQAAGEGRWREVAALYEEHAEHLPPALLAAAEVELGLNRAVDEETPQPDAEGEAATAPPPEEPPPASAFERRLRRAQEVDASGVQQLLFDRRGRPLGSIGDDRSLTLEPDLPAGLVPIELATHLLPPALQPPGLAAAGPGAMSGAAGARALRLTIDRAWSRAADEALGREEGAIAIVELPSGGVLAAVSNRSRSRRWRSNGDSILDPREPASISKLITTTATMRAGLDPDREIADMTCRGSVLMDGERLYCAAIGGRLKGLSDAMASSCNMAFARLAMDIGDRALVEEYERYGFVIGGRRGEPVPRSAIGVVHEFRHPGKRLGELSIGLEEASITPLGAALFAATLSDGRRHEPSFVLQADGLLGISPRKPAGDGPRQGREVLDPSWLPMLHESMRAVVSPGGTANRVAPKRLRVAMKTGTARDPDKPFHVNYVGFFPSDERQPPRYAFAVRVTGQPTSARVRRAGYAVTFRLLRALDRLVGDEIETASRIPPRLTGATGASK
ncbi:MAG: penicillin-binding transpeptidase domain-containing protein [Acidobacteria bacterium]|nr:penicillin-binding transpeptidase domain-containing protein [Acidobacteriota bacterium]